MLAVDNECLKKIDCIYIDTITGIIDVFVQICKVWVTRLVSFTSWLEVYFFLLNHDGVVE